MPSSLDTDNALFETRMHNPAKGCYSQLLAPIRAIPFRPLPSAD